MKARALLRQATGLDLSEDAVAHAVRRRLRVLQLEDPAGYEDLLAGEELARLVEEVVVPESWMFRDPEAFVQLVGFVQERVQERQGAPARPVRILSVPCAGGEEPYSMAIALFDAGLPPDAWRIDAVDVSQAVLERARAGRFSRNAFRGADLAFRERYFRRQDGGYLIDETLRAQVRFSQANLLDLEPEGQPYDVIFCRNLLIYFDEATVARAIARLAALLHDDGMLFAGYAEVPAYVRHGFVTLRAPGAFALRKAGARAAAPAPAPTPAPAPAPAPARPVPAVTRRSVRAPVATRPAAPAPTPPSPQDTDTRLQQARRLADGGDRAGAAAACRAVLDAQPDCAAAHYLLGVVSEAGDARAADLHYRRCIYLQPDHYEALCHLALLCEQAGDMAQAASFKQRAARVFARRAGSS